MSKKLLSIIIFPIFLFLLIITTTPLLAQELIECTTPNNGKLYITAEQCSGEHGLNGTIVNPDTTAGTPCTVDGSTISVANINECITLRNAAAARNAQNEITGSPITQDASMSSGKTSKPYFGDAGDSIGQYINSIYKYAIGVVGILATIVIMIGGLIWITSMGNASRVSNAKDWIGAALTGLALAMFSYTLLWIINPDLVNFKGVNPANVEAIPIEDDTEDYMGMPCKVVSESCLTAYSTCCSGLSCQSGICAGVTAQNACEGLPNGTRCMNYDDESGYCSNNSCVLLGNPGDVCSSNYQCGSGDCTDAPGFGTGNICN